MPERRPVLITGAGGFLGGRIAEVLHLSGLGPVRAGVRRWASAARIGRFPMEIVKCDVTSATDVEAAVAGVRSIVHCAVGGRNVTVDGTRLVLEAAQRHGVDRVVHISTIDVYGDATGDIDEMRPHEYTGRPYGDSKIDAEKLCFELAAKGLPVSVLRPSIIYGPFSDLWTVSFAQRLQQRPWLLPPEVSNGTCNLVYVDDVVAATVLALDHPAAVGQAFNVNGPDRPTWYQYFSALNDAMGLPPLNSGGVATARLVAAVMKPVRTTAKFALGKFKKQIMGLYQRSALAKKAMKSAEQAIRQSPSANEFRLYGKKLSLSTAKAEALIGYRPGFTMDDGLALSAAWLEHHGYVHR